MKMIKFLLYIIVGGVLATVGLAYLGVLNVDAVLDLVRGVLLQ